VTGRLRRKFPPDDDGPLVRRAQRGDRLAFELLLERHQARVFTLAARLLGSPDDAADAAQETFIRAWRGLPRFRGDARFSTWLHRICLNAVHDLRVRTPLDAPLDERSEPADPRDAQAQHELAGDLQAALSALPEDFRAAVVLYDVCGLPYAEIAALLGVAEGTVKSRIARGRRELARRLGTTEAAPESKRS
jgi:RNA polymerase sigma-70 factor, ECF subfamily